VVQVYVAAEVTLTGCLLTGGRGAGEGGGALDVQRGAVRLRACRLTRCRAPQGGAVRATGPALVELESCVLADNGADGVGGGGLFASRGAVIRGVGLTFSGNRAALGAVALAGGGQGGAGHITLRACLVDGADSGDLLRCQAGGTVALAASMLPQAPAPQEGLTLGGDVQIRRVELERDGTLPFAPRFWALLGGQGDATAFSVSEDVYGRARAHWLGAVGAAASAPSER
jgi:hypothetical protein